MSTPMRVLHVISGLERGGAERVLLRVVRGLGDRGIESSVIAARAGGPLAADLRKAGAAVEELGLARLAELPRAVLELRRITAAVAPQVIQGWMYHGNVLARLAGRPGVPVVFGVRHSLADLEAEKPGTRLAIRIGGLLSSRSAAVVYNSLCSMRQHEAYGYCSSRSRFIPNGFDTELLSPSIESRRATRARLGLRPESIVVGMVARFHPVKNHRMFLAAARDIRDAVPQTSFVIAGHGVTSPEAGLATLASDLGLADCTILLEDQADIAGLMNALDIAALTSNGEGFPNVVAEAMACGIPVVGTDVGDVAAIIGDAGAIVPAGDTQSFARAVIELSRIDRGDISMRARARIQRCFSESAMIDAFAQLYRGLAPQSMETR
ncbi:MAG: glycosyltransferase [Dehalococcoidia bacterium]